MLKSRSCLPPGFAMTKMKRPVERLISRGSKPYRRIEISSTSTRGKEVCCPAILVMGTPNLVSVAPRDAGTVSSDIGQPVAVRTETNAIAVDATTDTSNTGQRIRFCSLDIVQSFLV